MIDLSILRLGFSGNDAASASYVMPIDLVFKDIEVVIRLKVIESLYGGLADDKE